MTKWTLALRGSAAVLVMLAVACGDPDSNDRRGYTKAPLEEPELFISGEERGAVARYGEPNRVIAEAIELPEQVDAAPAAAGPDLAALSLPAGVTAAMVEEGQALYGGSGNCFTCHGAAGAGSPLAPQLNDGEWLNIAGQYEEIVNVIMNGVMQPKQYAVPMPARGGSTITDEQVRAVAAYVYAISHSAGGGSH